MRKKDAIKLQDDKLIVDFKAFGRTKAQKNQVKKFAERGDLESLIQYSKNFMGKRSKRFTELNRLKFKGYDLLEKKGKGTVLKLFSKMINPEIDHAPVNNHNDWIGVEIECFVPYESVHFNNTEETCNSCEGLGHHVLLDDDGNEIDNIECDSCGGSGTIAIEEGANSDDARKALGKLFINNKIKHATVKYDGSIRPDDSAYFGVEITVLTRLSEPSNLEKACNLLRDLKAKVNKSCGLHVHLDMRSKTWDDVKDIGKKFDKVLPLMATMVPNSRRNNAHYCQLRVSATERYSAVNLTSYRDLKTIEIRLHSATTDFNKIISWAKFLNLIADGPMFKKKVETLNEFTDFIYMPEQLLEYLGQRISLFEAKQKTEIAGQAIDGDDNTIRINGVDSSGLVDALNYVVNYNEASQEVTGVTAVAI